MLPKHHLILGFVFSLILLILFPQIGLFGFFIIFLSSFLIDIDHYLYYLIRKKDFNLKNAFNWFINNETKYFSLPISKRKRIHPPLCFMHTFEFLLIILILIRYSNIFLFLLIGFVFHLFLDIAFSMYRNSQSHDFSVIYHYLNIQFKKLKSIEDI